jgi:Lon protease-like protein
MNEIIPIFPLELVVFPGEALHLHIFEPRYKQLIHEIADSKDQFGIPSVVNKRMGGLGTMMDLEEITSVDENGEMDIKTRGREIFRIAEVVKLVPGKLYSGARVEITPNDLSGDDELMRQVLSGVRLMHKLLKVEKPFNKTVETLKSYDVAHHAGLSLKQEYELLGMASENQRLEFLNRHLTQILPTVMEMESLKSKIQMNGQFKKIPGVEL